jgi:hypothetical protein
MDESVVIKTGLLESEDMVSSTESPPERSPAHEFKSKSPTIDKVIKSTAYFLFTSTPPIKIFFSYISSIYTAQNPLMYKTAINNIVQKKEIA